MSNPNIAQRPYRLTAYDPEWPQLFTKYADQVRSVLGEHLLEIHHFGSTSIPGMFAKPNIDMYALVDSLENARQHKTELEKLSFTSRGDYSGIGEEYFTLDNHDGERIASLHIFEGSSDVFDDYKNFHDYLIANEHERERYIQFKKELYEKFKDDYPSYDAGKKQLIDELRANAKVWAQSR
jgi:GrpB-like predicted nucleotidyltransferase (UPF0157 family)